MRGGGRRENQPTIHPCSGGWVVPGKVSGRHADGGSGQTKNVPQQLTNGLIVLAGNPKAAVAGALLQSIEWTLAALLAC